MRKKKKATGELKLFQEIFDQRGGRCEITGEELAFNVWCFMHILSKGAYPSYRLKPENIMLVRPDIHQLYDCSDKYTLIKLFPRAEVIYERKEALKREYYLTAPLRKLG